MTDIDLTTITDADWPTFWAGVLAENARRETIRTAREQAEQAAKEYAEAVKSSKPRKVEDVPTTGAIGPGEHVIVGGGPTAAHPWYFDMGGIIYRATGTKNQTTGAYIISPVNETQWTSVHGGVLSAGDYVIQSGESHARLVAHTSLPSANYDRMVFGIGTIWAAVKSGNVDLELRMNGSFFRSRIPNVDDGNITASGAILLPAGTVPDFEVCAVAAGSGGNAVVTLVSDEWTRITVMAWPVSMA